ncbi:MAG: alpha/beta hydrolase [Gemmatimonadaceae bacterium]
MSHALSAEEALVSVTDVVDGVSIHGRVSPRGVHGRIPLVFVHGLGVSVRYLEPTMCALSGEHNVVGLDLPGFGRSGSPPAVLDTAGLARALGQWLDVRGIGPAILIGNSYGCQVIVELMMQDPRRGVGLVLNAPTMDPAHRTVFGQVIRVLADIPHEPRRLAWIVARDYIRAGPLRLLRTLRYALADHIEEKLPDIVIPAVIVCGSRDPVVTVAWAAQAARIVGKMSQGAPGATLSVVPTAAHALPYDDPATFAGLIDAFATRIRQGGLTR